MLNKSSKLHDDDNEQTERHKDIQVRSPSAHSRSGADGLHSLAVGDNSNSVNGRSAAGDCGRFSTVFVDREASVPSARVFMGPVKEETALQKQVFGKAPREQS